MKFTSVIASVLTVLAVASAQDSVGNVIPIEVNSCSNCTFAALPKEPTCATLSPTDLNTVLDIFKDNSVHLAGLGTAIKNENIKKCLCSWILGVFTGSGSSCLVASQGSATPACSEEQKNMAINRSAPFASLVNCQSVGVTLPTVGSNGTLTPPGVSSTNNGAQHPAGNAASPSQHSTASIFISVVAVVIAAAVGL